MHIGVKLQICLTVAAAIAAPAAAACSIRNLTEAAYQSIQPRMDLEQVTNLLGCAPAEVSASAGNGRKVVSWMSPPDRGTPIASVTVWFDSGSWRVAPIVPGTYKTKQGF